MKGSEIGGDAPDADNAPGTVRYPVLTDGGHEESDLQKALLDLFDETGASSLEIDLDDTGHVERLELDTGEVYEP